MVTDKRRTFGRVEELPSGRWRAYFKSEGLRHNAPVTFATKTDARLWLDTVRTDMTRGAWRAPLSTRYSLDDYATQWIALRPDLKESTRDLYSSTYRLHIAPLLGTKRLDKLTPDQVRNWHQLLAADLSGKLGGQARSRTATARNGSSTVARSYRLLHAIMQTAAEDELIQSNPCRIKGAGNAWSAERPTLNLHEVQALAERVPHHYAALVHLLVWTGVRIGEAAAMQRRDLDTASDRPTLTVRERAYRLQSGVIDLDSPKSKAGRRIIPLPPHLVPDIDAHLNQWTGESPSALVFTTSTGGSIISGYSQVFNRALNHIGRPDVRVHDLRHTGMTLAAQAGASVPELMRRLGQSSTTAAEGYLHTTADHGRAVAERMSELAAKSNVIPIRRASGETA